MNIPRKQAQQLLGILQQVREERGDIPVQMLETLLQIALHDGESQQAIQKLTKQTKASTSRNIQAWSNWTRQHKPGPSYIEHREDPYERRRKLCYLTKQGETFLKELLT